MNSIPQDSPQSNHTPATTFIYALLDPETNEVRYVGKTNNLKKRFNRHLRQNEVSYRQRWIEDLQKHGLKPSMKILEEVSVENWSERERYWIDFYRSQGCHLTNTALGGNGGNPSPETKAKIAASLTGKKHPPEFREKMRTISACKKGTKRPPEVGAKISAAKTGVKRKPFHRDNGKRGKPLSPEAKAKLFTPEAIAKRVATKRAMRLARMNPPSNPTLWDL